MKDLDWSALGFGGASLHEPPEPLKHVEQWLLEAAFKGFWPSLGKPFLVFVFCVVGLKF